MPFTDNIQEYIEYVEERVHTSIHAVAGEMPMIQEAIHRLWVDVSRFGPALPELHLPSLGEYEVPPPPPPPPPPLTAWERGVEWAGAHPWKVAGLGIGVVGVGLLVGYSGVRFKSRRRVRKTQASSERRKVVVLLGGDTPLALPLILDLENKGFIVIASVATPEAADELEQKCSGYVRALVLDPSEPATIPIFLRSLMSSLSRRFPINASGDPHATPSTHPYIHSLVSLLSLPTTTAPPTPAPLEHLDLSSTYLDHLTATHTTPLHVLQQLLPLLRTAPASARARDASPRSIVVCLPAVDTCVGLPFAAAQAMSAAATLRGVEILRRELSMTDTMRDIRVVYDPTGEWTPSERAAYGRAYGAVLLENPVQRRPADVGEFVGDVAEAVVFGRVQSFSAFGTRIVLGPVRSWLCGDRYAVGAGASTYALASCLPTALLDAILSIPHRLFSLQSALRPAPDSLAPSPPSYTVPAPAPAAKPYTVQPQAEEEASAGSEQEQERHDVSETGSEADVESNAGDGVGMGESWVSLKTRSSQAGDA
ncbi:hypothetical protein EVG20_g8026 [Dentipellis fragilis]|uniref:DUF1776-domain-containing protein n=1 Tax=Dentipellis fragilis TaxID=205917 RepID=A0A4Y9Y9R6_9AGAM|nr:hypothetical protein EVG20_g8026 [Dentipellis fragilis]